MSHQVKVSFDPRPDNKLIHYLFHPEELFEHISESIDHFQRTHSLLTLVGGFISQIYPQHGK